MHSWGRSSTGLCWQVGLMAAGGVEVVIMVVVAMAVEAVMAVVTAEVGEHLLRILPTQQATSSRRSF